MRKLLIAGLFMLLLSACSNNAPERDKFVNLELAPPPSDMKKAEPPGADATEDNSQTKALLDTSRKLIKEGEIDFETANLKATRKSILDSLAKFGGYLAEENETNDKDEDQNTLDLTLRVPSKNFDLLLNSVSSSAERIDSKKITVKDVTAEYIDIKTALYNKRLLESRYQDLLKKADKISDLLQIENKMTDIRTAIDSTQGQLNYLNKQIAFSVLTVDFYTRKLPQNTGYSVGYKFLAAMADGWGLLQNLFFGIISLWPVVILLLFFVLFIRRWRRNRKQRKLQALS